MQVSKIIAPLILCIAIGSVLGIYMSQLLIIFVAISFLLLFVTAYSLKKNYNNIIFVSLIVPLLTLGILRGDYLNIQNQSKVNLNGVVNKYLSLEGIIINNPEIKDGSQVFNLEVEENIFEVKVKQFNTLEYGDKINIYGKIKIPENFETKTGKIVQYSNLERARGISYIFDGKRFEIVSRNNGNYFLYNIYKFKRTLGLVIDRLPEPESGLLLSMVFGGKNSLPKDVIEYFRIAGLLHIVVLSGQNLTIVSYLVSKIFSKFVGFRFGYLLSILFLFIYAIMGGLESATLRAFIMSVLLIISSYIGKPSIAGRILLFSACFMIIQNPYILFDDPSFQLSVIAFAGIIFVSPIIERLFILKNVPIQLSGYLAAILGAQISVLPFLAYMTQSITPYALVANFFVLVVVGFVTIYGMLSVSLGLIWVHIFDIISLPILFTLKYIINVAKIISAFPYSSINIKISIIPVVIIYTYISFNLVKIWQREYMNPLSIFILKNNFASIRKGILPWVDEVESGTAFDSKINENRIIDWKK